MNYVVYLRFTYFALYVGNPIILISFVNQNFISQVANYVFSETSGSYQTIVTDVSLISVNGTIGVATSNRATTGLPFSFCLGGTTFAAGSDFTMSNDGWVAFGKPTVNNTTSTQPLTNFNNCLSAFGTDLQTTGTSTYGARVEGTAPFRVLVLQWGQSYFGDYDPPGATPFVGHNYWKRVVNGHNNDCLHFQIRLHESSGVIEFCYLFINPRTTTSGSVTSDIQVGLREASASDFDVRTKTTTNSAWNGNSSAGTALPSGTSNTMNFNNVRGSINNKPGFVEPVNRGSANSSAGKAGPGTATIFRWVPVGGPSDPPSIHSGCYNPLPVELSNFEVEKGENKNRVKWSTLSELNSDHFTIERSLNGSDWTSVGRVQSVGNSSLANHYEFIDEDFESTINYYRLIQVDFDGTSKIYDMTFVDNRVFGPELLKVYTILGQEVDENYVGLVIELYSDGSTKKYFKE